MKETTFDGNQGDCQTIESAEDLVALTEYDFETCMNITECIENHSLETETDYIIVEITEWLADQKSGSELIIANEVADVSAKSYLAEDAYYIPKIVFTDQLPLGEDVPSPYEVDESDGEYVDESGKTFLPKSQTGLICQFADWSTHVTN